MSRTSVRSVRCLFRCLLRRICWLWNRGLMSSAWIRASLREFLFDVKMCHESSWFRTHFFCCLQYVLIYCSKKYLNMWYCCSAMWEIDLNVCSILHIWLKSAHISGLLVKMLEIRLFKPSFLCKKSTLLLVESMILRCFVISTVSRVRFCVTETLANAHYACLWHFSCVCRFF